MLVLNRKPGEQVCIDGDIRITVVEVQGNRVRLGIEAPPQRVVLRAELLQGFTFDVPGRCGPAAE